MRIIRQGPFCLDGTAYQRFEAEDQARHHNRRIFPVMRILARASATLACLTTLVACGAEPFDVQEGFFGGVAADEPRAALIMRDVLVEGGRAADAAVAGYFALSVTLPSSAGLSATGSCVVFDPLSERYERLDFPALPSADEGAVIALPLAPRAMFALHARYGRLRFERLITGAEHLARFGEPISTRLAADLGQGDPTMLHDPTLAEAFGRQGGGVLGRGETLTQIDLGATLGRLRSTGMGDLYVGPMSRSFAAGVKAAGYAIDIKKLRAVLPRWSNATGVEHSNHNWVVVGADPAAGQQALSMLEGLFENGGWGGSDGLGRARLMAKAAQEFGAQTGVSVRPDIPGATSFMAVDQVGQMVACAIGMGRPFGLGKAASGTGIVLRSAEVAGPASALALIVGNKNTWQVHLGATAGGGKAALSALLQPVLDQFEGDLSSAEALEAPRTYPDLAANTIYVEEAWGANAHSALAKIGLGVKMIPSLGRAALLRCVDGLAKEAENCDLAGDRRGGGLVLVERD
jgi:gamma-glutamyltranspeptidase/glutathione hydrolase